MLTLLVAVGGGGLATAFGRAARRAGAGTRVRGLGARTRWRLPAPVRTRLAAALADAAVDLEPEGACELALAGTGAAALLSAAVAPSLLVPVTLAALAAGPVALHIARTRARRRFVAALPGALEHVAAALRGGAGVGDALDALPPGNPLTVDLRRLGARTTLGLGLADALGTWAEERPLPAVRAAAGALAVAVTMGGRSADALDGLASSLRARLGAAAEARALSSQARMSAVVVGGAPVAFVVLSALIDPTSVRALVATNGGRICLVVGVLLEAVAVVWMRHIVGAGEPA
jgi:tight adherence protein B